MPTQLEKLEAHASHMFDAFIKLRQRYSIFEPLLFDKTVVTTLGSGKRAVGFSILKDSLSLPKIDHLTPEQLPALAEH